MNPPEVASSFFRPLQANLRLGQEVPDDRPDVETVLGAGDPFAFGPEVRKIIYTTNAIESLHMQLLKVIKNRGHFPSDQSAIKLIYLAVHNITKKWSKPPIH